jgi:phosphatidylglycerophosphate synthase
MASVKRWLGGDTDALVLRLFPFAERLPLSPDALSLLGVGFAGATAVAFYADRPRLAALLLALAGWCDLVDGAVARRRNAATLAGGFTDSSLDRLADMLVFGGIALGAARRAELLLCFVSIWAATAAYLVSYTRARAEVHLHRLDHGLFGRFERFAVLLAGALSGWLLPALGLVAVGSSATAAGRILAGRRLLDELERTGIDPTSPSHAPAPGPRRSEAERSAGGAARARAGAAGAEAE